MLGSRHFGCCHDYGAHVELAGWRQALLEALGPNGRLMVDLVPELSLIIGDQPPIPELEPQTFPARVPPIHWRISWDLAKLDRIHAKGYTDNTLAS